MPFRYFALLALALLSAPTDSKAQPTVDLPFTAPAVTYHPRGFSLGAEASRTSKEQIIDDLRLLRTQGFRSLVTYGADGVLGSIPETARHEGFDGMVIMGIWDPFSEEEWTNAIAQARFVDGYCLGNEGLGLRYSPEDLAFKMTEMRRSTGRPVTTSEQIDSYLNGPYRDWLLAHSDWLFPLAHPFWAAQSAPSQAVKWIMIRHDYLAAATGRKVTLKEAGFPSAGCPKGCTEEAQVAFFEALDPTGIRFFYFEAFDQPWKRDFLKHDEVEAHWGLYRADGAPKKVIPWLANRWRGP